MSDPKLEIACVNALRVLAVDTVEKAKSGHPGLPMGAAPFATVLWRRYLRHDPGDPAWPDRDRFVLSAGHGSALIYGLLHLSGYQVFIDDLKAFRAWGSRTPGHPEAHQTPGVEATTGPLGQGTGVGLGMAVAERALAARFNRPGHEIVDHRTYCLVSDGDLMEGIASEAASLAGHLKLSKLTYLYDANDISLDGPTSLAFSTENVAKRFEAYGWYVQTVSKGDEDLESIDKALAAAKAQSDKPSLILIKTTIGYGSPNKKGSAKAHGSPLGPEEAALAKAALGADPQKFFEVPAAALAAWREALDRGRKLNQDWKARFAAYEKAFPGPAKEFGEALKGTLPLDWKEALPSFKAGEKLATRVAGGKVLNGLASKIPALLGGDADLSVSTGTGLDKAGSFDGRSGQGRNIHFGVREHAMAACANGMAYHGGVRPFTATFFQFSDYMRPSVRLACLDRLPVIHVWTHDSVALGEDGPTHQPVEHLAALRAMPGMTLIRPCDAEETKEAWTFAMEYREGPVGLVLSRQNLETLDRSKVAPASGLRRGAYILSEATPPPHGGGKPFDPAQGSERAKRVEGGEGGSPKGLIIATGSEVHIALAAQAQLQAQGIPVRVVSLPCWQLFEKQDQAYKDEVLPPAIEARVSIEAGATFGWSRWLGPRGRALGLDRFGASAPGEVIMEKLGLTPGAVVEALKGLLRA